MIKPGMKVRVVKYIINNETIVKTQKELVLFRIHDNHIITAPISQSKIKGICYIYETIENTDEYLLFGLELENNEKFSKFFVHHTWKYEYKEEIEYINHFETNQTVYLLTPQGMKKYNLEGNKLKGEFRPEFSGSPVMIDKRRCIGMAIFEDNECLFIPNYEVIM